MVVLLKHGLTHGSSCSNPRRNLLLIRNPDCLIPIAAILKWSCIAGTTTYEIHECVYTRVFFQAPPENRQAKIAARITISAQSPIHKPVNPQS